MGGLPFSEMREEFPELLKGIERSSNRIKQIVLDLKKYAMNDDSPMDETFDINQVIQNAIQVMNKTIESTTHNFTCDLAQEALMMDGNMRQLEQVLINLIENACQSIMNKDEGVSITSCLNKDRDQILIEVQDQGIGIPSSAVSHIMEPFFTTKRKGGGSGLGLAISSKIIKRHGGSIEVQSLSEKGSLFSVHLPLIRNEDKYKILIVDDDSGTRKIIKKMLQSDRRLMLSEAKSGSDALLQIGLGKPDLLVLDIHMPDLNGVDVCRLLKKKPELSSIKVIIISGFLSSSEAEEIKALGFETHFEKPFHKNYFLTTIDNILGS
jgi:CheY-like chemotaxis protein